MTDVEGDRLYHCGICGEPLDDDRDIIVLRIGTIKKSPKHGGWYFHPKAYEDGRIVRLFCFHCMMAVGFEFADSEDQDGPDECAFCPEDLVGEERCFEMELGEFIGKIRRWRVHGQGKAARLWCCWDCVENTLGEGNNHTFRKRAGLSPLPDQREWIDEDEVPTVMKKIRRVPRATYSSMIR